jgi:hypothetical protein
MVDQSGIGTSSSLTTISGIFEVSFGAAFRRLLLPVQMKSFARRRLADAAETGTLL